MDIEKAKRRYASHRNGAKKRGIGFELTFEEWLRVWGDKLDRCGVAPDKFGMCRVMDRGPYAVGNVFIGTPKRNAHTRKLVRHDEKMQRLREEAARVPEPPPDPDWEEENPWLPEEFKPRNSWGWDKPF